MAAGRMRAVRTIKRRAPKTSTPVLNPVPITPEQLARLVDRHAGALVLFARQWCRTPEDVVQDALLALVRQPVAPDSPAAWLYRAVRNGAISAGRQASRRQRREQVRAKPEAWFECNTQRLDAAVAMEALGSLSVELREVIVARIWGELTFAEIGQLVGTSLSTAQRRNEQGMKVLRTKLDSTCDPTQTPRLS